jgi:thiamine pyrophosphokinase
VIAADGGARWALDCGLLPHLVIGDLDSIDAVTLDRLRELAVPIEALPTDKDATDGELALQYALATQPAEVIMVGALGGPRFDHGLANCLLLTAPPAGQTRISLLDNTTEVRLVRPQDPWRWTSTPGEVVSLIPVGARAEGIHTDGLRWPLQGATLPVGRSRGVSNEAIATEAMVQVASGSLFVIRTLPAGQLDWSIAD